MRIGLLGPAEGNTGRFREAAEFLLNDYGVDLAIYLGDDDIAPTLISEWAQEIMGGPPDEESFLTQAAQAALSPDPEQLDVLLARDDEVARLAAIRCLPPHPARAVELLNDKVIVFVHDKALLDPEDIENAFLVVYGRAPSHQLHRFGPRVFFSPGPLDRGQVAVIEREEKGGLSLLRFDPRTGEPLGQDIAGQSSTRMVVLP